MPLTNSDIMRATLPTNAQLAHPASTPGADALAALDAAQLEHNTLINEAKDDSDV